jgi:hypothetical protein
VLRLGNRTERRTTAVDRTGGGQTTWHSTLELVREIRTALRPPNVPTRDALAQVAQQIQQYGTELVGDMPLVVGIFLRDYGEHVG